MNCKQYCTFLALLWHILHTVNGIVHFLVYYCLSPKYKNYVEQLIYVAPCIKYLNSSLKHFRVMLKELLPQFLNVVFDLLERY